MSNTSRGEMMRAAVLTQYGDDRSVQFTANVSRPKFGSEEVLIRVRACALTPLDSVVRRGDFKDIVSLPCVTGYGYSGVIEAVGARVVDFRVGDAVVGVASLTTKHGGLAEFTAQSPNALVPKPDALTFEDAAACVLPGLTAYRALHIQGKVSHDAVILYLPPHQCSDMVLVSVAAKLGARVIVAASDSETVNFYTDSSLVLRVIDLRVDSLVTALSHETGGLGASIIVDARSNSDISQPQPPILETLLGGTEAQLRIHPPVEGPADSEMVNPEGRLSVTLNERQLEMIAVSEEKDVEVLVPYVGMKTWEKDSLQKTDQGGERERNEEGYHRNRVDSGRSSSSSLTSAPKGGHATVVPTEDISPTQAEGLVKALGLLSHVSTALSGSLTKLEEIPPLPNDEDGTDGIDEKTEGQEKGIVGKDGYSEPIKAVGGHTGSSKGTASRGNHGPANHESHDNRPRRTDTMQSTQSTHSDTLDLDVSFNGNVDGIYPQSHWKGLRDPLSPGGTLDDDIEREHPLHAHRDTRSTPGKSPRRSGPEISSNAGSLMLYAQELAPKPRLVSSVSHSNQYSGGPSSTSSSTTASTTSHLPTIPILDLMSCLAVGGQLLTLNQTLCLDSASSRLLFLRSASLAFIFPSAWLLSPTHLGQFKHVLIEVVRSAANRQLCVPISARYPLERIRQACRDIAAVRVGCVVIQVSSGSVGEL